MARKPMHDFPLSSAPSPPLPPPLLPTLSESDVEMAHPSPRPAAGRCWFERSWQYLFVNHLINGPDDIVVWSHNRHAVTVTITSGQQFCIDKARLNGEHLPNSATIG